MEMTAVKTGITPAPGQARLPAAEFDFRAFRSLAYEYRAGKISRLRLVHEWALQ